MKKITVIISLVLLMISCKKEDNHEINSNKNKISHKGSIEFRFDFPDTVLVNNPYKGEIKFKGIFDTLTTNVMEPVDGINRYIFYSLTKTKNIDYSFEQLKKTKLDTFGAIDNRTIPLDNIFFEETGVYYIDGILNDQATIDMFKKSMNPTDMIRYLEKEVRVTHKVIVIKD